jgi:rod shape determining protein RodA
MRRWNEVLIGFDWTLLFAALALTAIGLLAIYGINISQGAVELFQFKKQFVAAGLGIIAVCFLAFVDFRQIRAMALPIYFIGVGVLIASLIFGVKIHGGGRWFQLGALSFQPVEIAKITLAIFLASYLSRYTLKRLSWTAFIGSGLATAVYLGLVLLQPDFGSGMVLVAIWLAAVIFCGLPKHAWWILLVSILSMSVLLWNFALKPYQRDRIRSFIDPSADPRGAAYNVTQAKIAIGSGGWFGKGIGEGSQARLRFLPVASSDFMFAVIGEELGFVGVAVMLILFGLLFYRMIRLAMLAEDAFAGVLLVSLAAFVAFHLAVNAGMNLGISPVTGIPLPFVSAAASSVVVMYLVIGLAESVAAQRNRF